MVQLLYALKPLVKSERGATMVEYGIIVALIAVVSIAVIATLGLDVLAAFTRAEEELPPAQGGP